MGDVDVSLSLGLGAPPAGDDVRGEAMVSALQLLLAGLDPNPVAREKRWDAEMLGLHLEGQQDITRALAVLAVVGGVAVEVLRLLFGDPEKARRAASNDLASLLERREG